MLKIIREMIHRAFLHAHEIVVALVVEGSRASVFFMLLLVALILVVFAVQALISAEEG